MISRSDKIALVCRFREMSLARYVDDIETLLPSVRERRIGLDEDKELLRKLHVGDVPGPIEDICRLVKTPRLLKLIFRNSFLTWERMHGELDFDDILVANVLRFAAPEAFEFLLTHSGELRALELSGVFDKRPERLKDVESKWDKFTNTVAWDTASAKELIQFLFPNWKEAKTSWGENSPQGVSVSKPIDYWTRFLDGEVDSSEFTDQEVLRGLDKFKKDSKGKHFKNMSVYEALNSGSVFTDRFEHLSLILLSGQDIRNIASGLFEIELASKGPLANADKLGGFIPLWRIAIASPLEESAHVEWVQSEVCKAIPTSLKFANDIYYYWNSNNNTDIETKKYRPELRAAIIKCAKENFANKPEALIKAINPGFMYSSRHFSVLFSSPENHGGGFVAADWEWFVELLISAAETNAQKIVPQIASFLVKEERTYSGFTYELDESCYETLFKKYQGRLVKLLSTDILLDDFNDRERAMLKFVNELACKWINDALG